MQNANHSQRPTGRGRPSVSSEQPQICKRATTSSALNVAVSSIISSNETTNHFLGSGAVQRPWMRSAASGLPHQPSTTIPSAHPSHEGLTSSATDVPAPAVLANESTPANGADSTFSPPLGEKALPLYRFVPSPPSTSAECAAGDKSPQADTGGLTHRNLKRNRDVIEETKTPSREIEVLDLTLSEGEESPPTQSVPESTLAPTSHREVAAPNQPSLLPEVPPSEPNSKPDMVTTDEHQTSIDQRAAQNLPTSTFENTQPRGTTSPQHLAQWSSTNSVSVQTGKDTSISNDDHGQSINVPSSALPVGNGPRQESLGPTPPNPAPHNKSAVSVDTQSSYQLSNTQLLTPENSPLNQFNHHLSRKRTGIQAFSSVQHPENPQKKTSHTHSSSRGVQENPTTQLVNACNQPTCQTGESTASEQSRPPPQASNSSVPKASSILATLNSNVEEMSSRIDLNTPQWKMRLPWLEAACKSGDLLFLHLNQLFCLWSLNTAASRCLGLSQACDTGFFILELLFGKNQDLPRELFVFLAGWPSSTYALEFSQQLTQWTSGIAQFLPILGSRWQLFRQHHIDRGIPPMVTHIVHNLSCPLSTTLPSAIFCSIQKQLCPKAPAEIQMLGFNLFKNNMRDAYNGIPTSGNITHFENSYRAIYVHYSQMPGLTQDQINEVNGLLARNNLLRPSTAGSQTPTQYVRVGTGPNSNLSASFIQQNLGNTNRAMQPVQAPGPLRPNFARTQNVSISQNRSIHPSEVTRNQDSAPSLAPPPLLAVGHSPSAHERLLPINSQHLPDFLVNPNPAQEALHQVQLRQPITELRDMESSKQTRLYQYIEAFLLKPHFWLPASGFIVVHFDATSDLVGKRSEILEQFLGTFELPKRIIHPGSVIFNLRCVKLSDCRDDDDLLGSSWAARPTCWPQHLFISLNGHHLEIRRKRHHRRDLPIDVTSFVKAGRNEVKISVHPEDNERDIQHGVAVEVIGFHNHQDVVKLATKISSTTALEAITSSMAHQQNSDDDVVLVDGSMTISVTDPFSSRMFTTPVRGKTCKHHECFDLETFLTSRQSDNKDALTGVYVWQCPICKEDARPCSLVIDGFFQAVRDKLVSSNQKEVRAIIVKADGSWLPKLEA